MPVLTPGESDQGAAYQSDARAVFTGPGDHGSGHWYGSVVTNDITILPNDPAISASASMFLDNNAGQVWEFFSDNTGEFGVFDKTGNGAVLFIQAAAGNYRAVFSGPLVAQNNTLDDGTGKLYTTNDTHIGQWLYVTGNALVSGGLGTSLVTKTISYTLSSTDSTVLLNGATLTATLPDATSILGRIYTVKLIAAGTTGTVATTSSQTIDGVTTYSLGAQYRFVTVQSDGSNWQIISKN